MEKSISNIRAMRLPRALSPSGLSPRAFSRQGIRAPSRAGSGDAIEMSSEKHIRNTVMISFLRQRQVEKQWCGNTVDEGVVLKNKKSDFVCLPETMNTESDGFYRQVKLLNTKVAMTVKTAVIAAILQTTDLPYISLPGGLRLQVLPDISGLSRCQKHHFAAFIRNTGTLVVWDDEPLHIIERAEKIELYLVGMVWNTGKGAKEGATYKVPRPSSPGNKSMYSTKEMLDHDPEVGLTFSDKPRRTMLFQAVLIGFAGMLAMMSFGLGWRRVAIEIGVDHTYTRLALAAAIPAQIWLGWSLITSVAQILGPVNQICENSRFFSGVRSTRALGTLPHVTVQCPVYKEGLWSVIAPTVVSLKAAISTYEMQGGSASIFINDDGMQLISETEAKERREYYEENNIGWVARPRHNPKGPAGDNFCRPGKFKKASNMNYALNITVRVEEKLAHIHRSTDWMQEDEDEAYNIALQEVILEDKGRTWAEGNIRVGEYILIIDSDTRVPTDCFLDAISEMESSPQVAIIQFSSGVMNVTNSFFEKGITFFTKLVYTAIQFAVANGDVAPFVGHNAILRWSAIQDIGYMDIDGAGYTVEKYWAETTVSEDFDLALRLQATGYDLRFAVYFSKTHGFQEGVSLNVYDELSRWEKYAFGCSEMIFNPFRYWPTRGPVTPLFRKFITSKMSLTAKITVMSYLGTYYALASSWFLTLLNYFLIGWFNGYLDHYYLDSFKIYFSIVLVFQLLGNVALAIFRYRAENRSLVGAALENLTWIPLVTIFLGGISLHISQSFACHMFGVDMTWGATSKEAANTTFFAEVPKILRKFKFTFLFCFTFTAGMIVMAGVGPVGQLVPYDWRITTLTAIFPLSLTVTCHFLLPLVLNPGLVQFKF